VAEYTPGIGVDDNDSFVISQIIFVSIHKRDQYRRKRERERETVNKSSSSVGSTRKREEEERL